MVLTLFSCMKIMAQDNERIHIRNGNKLYNDSLFVDAEIEYRKALDINPSSTEAMYNLGNTFLMQQKAQEAMKQFFKNAITSTVDWVKGMGSRVKTGVVAVCIAILSPVGAFAQSLANTGYDAGTSAMEEVATQIAAYVPYVVNLCYALAGVVAIVGAISVYIAMNNEEQDVKKKIMMVVGACIFLIAAANALPLFFGITG